MFEIEWNNTNLEDSKIKPFQIKTLINHTLWHPQISLQSSIEQENSSRTQESQNWNVLELPMWWNPKKMPKSMKNKFMNISLVPWRYSLGKETKENQYKSIEIEEKNQFQTLNSGSRVCQTSPMISRRRRWYQWTQESSTMPEVQPFLSAVAGDGRNAPCLLSDP